MDWKSLRPWILPMPAPSGGSGLQLSPGLRHYCRQRDGQFVRYHLRVENSGQALLIAAAVEVARLTRSGAIAAYGVLEGKSVAEITNDLDNLPTASHVIADVQKLIDQLGRPSKRYPVFNLADPLSEQYALGLIAPFQADVALGELGLTKSYLGALWKAGIPHVRFVDIDTSTTLTSARLDTLCRAIEHAEDLGMIVGVRMKASSFAQGFSGKMAIDRIAEMGVDYVVTPWGVSARYHDHLMGTHDLQCFAAVVDRGDHWEFPVVLDAGLTVESARLFEEELDKVIDLNIAHVEVFALARRTSQTTVTAGWPDAPLTPFEAHQLRQLASWIEDLADARSLQIIWLPPHTFNSDFTHEKLIGQLRRGPRAGADISVRVDTNGQVYPPRGPRVAVGAIDRTDWSEIWNHPCFRSFREMVRRTEHCSVCPLLTMCASYCPADEAGWTIED